MSSFYYKNKKKRRTMIMQYIMYPLLYLITLEVICCIVFSNRMTTLEYIKNIALEWDSIAFDIFLTLFLLWWYGGDKVVSFGYNSEQRIFTIQYYDWCFRPKNMKIHAENIQYQVLHTPGPTILPFNVCIFLVDRKTKKTINFSSGFGWKNKQVNEIADRLKKQGIGNHSSGWFR